MYHSYHSIDKLDKPTGELFLVNPRNEAFAYGQVDRPARDATTGCALLFLVPFVLAGVLVASWTIVQWRDWVVLTYSGANVTGYITDRSISESDDSTSYHAHYRYVINDYEYNRREQVSYDLYRRAEIGGAAQVLYFTGDPNIATLDINFNNMQRLFLTFFTLFWDGFVGLIFFGVVYSTITNRYLARTGRVTFGQITALRSKYDSDNDYQIEVDYTFDSPASGRQLRDKHKFQDNSRKGQHLPTAGATVAILFSNDKTYRLL